MIITGVTHFERTLSGFNVSICDLSVVNNQGIAAGATRSSVCPANALGELGISIRQEELYAISTRAFSHRGNNHTIEPSVIFLVLAQALMTKGSLEARTAMISTPLALSCARF